MAINVIRNSVGTYNYVGKVPVGLAHKISGGRAADRMVVNHAVAHSGPGIARKIAERNGIKFSTRTFDTAKEAGEFAEEWCRCNGVRAEVNY